MIKIETEKSFIAHLRPGTILIYVDNDTDGFSRGVFLMEYVSELYTTNPVQYGGLSTEPSGEQWLIREFSGNKRYMSTPESQIAYKKDGLWSIYAFRNLNDFIKNAGPHIILTIGRNLNWFIEKIREMELSNQEKDRAHSGA